MQLTITKGLHAIASWEELPHTEEPRLCTVMLTAPLGPRYEAPFAASLPDEGMLYVLKGARAFHNSQYPIRGIACVVDLDCARLVRGVQVPLYGNRILHGVYDACRDYVHLSRCEKRYMASQTDLMRFLFQYLLDARLIELVSDPFVNSISDYIESAGGRHLCVADLVELCNMNRTAFTRKFTERFGMPPQQYILMQRMERARQQLANGQPIKEVALTVGYNDTKAFSRAFKKAYGVNPGQVRGGNESSTEMKRTKNSGVTILL